MSIKNKINFEQNQDAISEWLNTSKTYRFNKRERYLEYLHQLHIQFPQTSNLLNNFNMSYTNFVNLITKNAIVATIIMILALGTVSVAAAELFAPKEYKPSTVLKLSPQNKTNTANEHQGATQSQSVTNFEECAKITGKVLESYPRQCVYNGQTFVEEININPVEPEPTEMPDIYTDWKIYQNDEYNFQFKYPNDYKTRGNINASIESLAIYESRLEGAEGQSSEIVVNIQLPNQLNNTFDQFVTHDQQNSNQLTLINQEKTSKDGHEVNKSIFKVQSLNGQTYQITKYYVNLDNAILIFKTTTGITSTPEMVEEKNTLLNKIFDSLTFTKNESATLKTYTNPRYPNLSIPYDASWVMETTNETRFNDADLQYTTLTFKKSRLELKYIIMDEPAGVGILAPICTNNENAFLGFDNGIYKIRLESSSRNYSSTVQLNTSSNYPASQDLVDSSTDWTYFTSPGQTYKACLSHFFIPTVSTNQHTNKAIFTIKLKGIDSSNSNLMPEADKIVASTKF